MNNKTVVINSESKKKSKNNININWQPIRDGDAFKKYLDFSILDLIAGNGVVIKRSSV